MGRTQAQGRGPAAADVGVRTAAATVGAYGVAYVLTAILAWVFGSAGWDRVDAVILSSSLGLAAFPAVSIWAFAERRLAVVGVATLIAAVALVAAILVLRR